MFTLMTGLLVMPVTCFAQASRVEYANRLLLQGLVAVRADAWLLAPGELVQRTARGQC